MIGNVKHHDSCSGQLFGTKSPAILPEVLESQPKVLELQPEVLESQLDSQEFLPEVQEHLPSVYVVCLFVCFWKKIMFLQVSEITIPLPELQLVTNSETSTLQCDGEMESLTHILKLHSL